MFSLGDAGDLKTWSNVPYFFSKSLEQKGLTVNHVNIEENKLLNQIYRFTFFALLKIVYPKSYHTFFRTRINHLLVRSKMKKAVKRYAQSDAFVVLSFSFPMTNPGTKPWIVFGDWTYLYYIKNLKNREPRWFEKTALKREKDAIEKADLVVSLFPVSAAFIKQQFHQAKCHYFGNVVNIHTDLNPAKAQSLKENSRSILFIGNKKYLSGAKELIEALKGVVKKEPSAELHLIGLNESDTGVSDKHIYHHGYLDKGDKTQNELYYNLIYKARVIVNTTAGWGAFSAITEAMFCYTPVITSAYSEFLESYGQEPDFGDYVEPGDTKKLSESIVTILQKPSHEYIKLSEHAHLKAKDHTWENFTEKFLDAIRGVQPKV